MPKKKKEAPVVEEVVEAPKIPKKEVKEGEINYTWAEPAQW